MKLMKRQCVRSLTDMPAYQAIAAALFCMFVAAACSTTPFGDASPADADVDDVPTDNLQRDDVQSTEVTESPQSTSSFAAPELDTTVLPVDDAVRVGTLGNGLTYYVRRNNSPGGSVSMQLAVRAGGINEDPLGTGIAHFLEHMMFNGTEEYPGNTLDDALRDIGAEIGPDFNAFTSDSATVYQLSVSDERDNVDTAMNILSQWASAATIDPAEVAAEAPVVREELRLRDETPDGKMFGFFQESYYANTPYEGVEVSGTAESIAATTADQLRDYYERWYVPDNMAVVVVGDMDIDELESLVEQHFEELPSIAAPTPPPAAVTALRQDALVETWIDPELSNTFVSVDVPIQAWDSRTVRGNELAIVQTVAGILIDNRLNEGVSTGRLDLRRGGGGWFTFNSNLSFLGFNIDADDLVVGTEALFTELAGSLQNPFTTEELGRAVDAVVAAEEQRLVEAASTQDDQFASLYVQHFLTGADARGVQDSAEANIEFLGTLDADDVNNHWGWMLTNAEPIVIAVGPDEQTVGSRSDHVAAIERASTAVVTQTIDDLEEIDVLVATPDQVEEIQRQDHVKNDGVLLNFANGASVLFAPSEISAGQVSFVTESPGGRIMLSAVDGPVAPLAIDVIGSSGLGEWEPLQVERFLADRDVALSPYIADFSEGFSGAASTEDVETLFQLFHASIVGPRVDEVPLAQQRQFAFDALEFAQRDGATASDVAVFDARTGGGRLAALPTTEAIQELDEEQIRSIWDDRFGQLDDHIIVIVGDVDEDTIIDLSRTWIGSLPQVSSGLDDPQPLADPASERLELSVGTGTASGAYRFLSVGTATESVESLVLTDITTTLLNDRIFTVVREELGATYGGQAFIDFNEPGDAVELTISIDGDPDRIDEIAATVANELETLRTVGPTSAEFSQAVSIVSNEYNFISNQFILLSLFDEAYGLGDDIRDRTSQFQFAQNVTANDIATFVDQLVGGGSVIDVRNTP